MKQMVVAKCEQSMSACMNNQKNASVTNAPILGAFRCKLFQVKICRLPDIFNLFS